MKVMRNMPSLIAEQTPCAALNDLTGDKRQPNKYHTAKTTPISRIVLSEKLTSFGIMVAQFRAPLKPLVHQNTIILKGLNALNWASIMPRDASLTATLQQLFCQQAAHAEKWVFVSVNLSSCTKYLF